jgi:hypothetical protein
MSAFSSYAFLAILFGMFISCSHHDKIPTLKINKELDNVNRIARMRIPRVNFLDERALDAFAFVEYKIQDYCIQANVTLPKLIFAEPTREMIKEKTVTHSVENISPLELLLYLCRKFDLQLEIKESDITISIIN